MSRRKVVVIRVMVGRHTLHRWTFTPDQLRHGMKTSNFDKELLRNLREALSAAIDEAADK